MGEARRAVFGGSKPGGSYTPAIVASGRTVYVSGQGPFHNGVLTGATAAEQTRVALANLLAVLAEAGAGPHDVVRCGVYLADLADFPAMDAVFAEVFPEPRPARTTVGVALPGFLVEVDAVAVLPS